MTHSQINFTLSDLLTEMVTQGGFDILPELVSVIINQAMKIEREQHLGAQLYERTNDRRGYANGYKPKTLTNLAAVQKRTLCLSRQACKARLMTRWV